ncbi:MAG: hypothetical protein ACI86H_002260 [bacterium]|jgi:hypothetical protein
MARTKTLLSSITRYWYDAFLTHGVPSEVLFEETGLKKEYLENLDIRVPLSMQIKMMEKGIQVASAKALAHFGKLSKNARPQLKKLSQSKIAHLYLPAKQTLKAIQ